MRILMVNPNVVLGGAQKIMLYLARGLARRGHEVFILTTRTVDFEHLPPFARDFRYLVCDVELLKRGGELAAYTMIDNVFALAWRLWTFRRAVVRAIREHRIDLVNPHNPPAHWVCAFLRVPVAWSCHNNPMAIYRNIRRGYVPLVPSKSRWYHRLGEGLYELADYLIVRCGIPRIVSLSDKIAKDIRQVYHRSSVVNVFAVSDEDQIMQGAEPSVEKFLAQDGRCSVIQVGQLTTDKNPWCALRAAQLARRRVPHLTLTFAGDGPLRQALEETIRREGCAAWVRILGYQDEGALRRLYDEAHVLLFPGAEQPLGIAPIEAALRCVIPIVSETSGVWDVLERYGIGVSAPPTPEAFAQRLIGVWERRRTIAATLRKARDVLAEALSYEAFIGRYEQWFAAWAGRADAEANTDAPQRVPVLVESKP